MEFAAYGTVYDHLYRDESHENTTSNAIDMTKEFKENTINGVCYGMYRCITHKRLYSAYSLQFRLHYPDTHLTAAYLCLTFEKPKIVDPSNISI